MKHTPLTLILFSLLFPASLEAARPLNTDDAGTVAPRTVELEIGFDYGHTKDKSYTASLVATTGILDHMDLSIELPYQWIDFNTTDTDNGLSDIVISTKWNLINDFSGFDGAITLSYKAANGDDDRSLGTGEEELSFTAVVSREFEHLSTHINLGTSIIHDIADTFNYNFAVEWPITEQTNLGAEIYGIYDFHQDLNENSLSTLIGLNHSLNDHIIWDLGVGLGIADVDPDLSVLSGFTISLP